MFPSANPMQQPKIDVKPAVLSQLLSDMSAGKLQVPRFQREFVWPLTKTRELLDSMYKEFPIGTFFLWKAPAGSPHLVRPLMELGIATPPLGAEVSYILDGQQRLTSLYAVITGARIGSRNYGRISIDLETATRYASTKDEGFGDDIFVYQTPDNCRYVAVKDLVSGTHMAIYDQIPREWRSAFIKAYQVFQSYPFSVVWIQEQTLADAIDIFQRINQAGQRLSRYDLVCANLWAETFDFRNKVTVQNAKFKASKFGALHETIYTQAFALILKNSCTTVAELSLETEEIRSHWDKAIEALELAVNFAYSNLGVKQVEFLPYRGLLPVLAYFFYHAPSSALSVQQRDILWQWFWRVSLSERYSSTSPSRMAEDALKLVSIFKGEAPLFNYPSKVTSQAVQRTKMSSTSSALRNAVLCLLAIQPPINFKDNSPINLGDEFFSDVKSAERHHVFPVGYLKSKGLNTETVHLLPNFCFIPADLNKVIGSHAPADYMAKIRQENPDFAKAMKTHLIGVAPASAVWANDYGRFLEERASLIAKELNRYADAKPSALNLPVNEEQVIEPSQLATMEIRLRDVLDRQLTATMGESYWKAAIPGDVIAYAKEKLRSHLTSNPHSSPDQFASGRSKLDFCDMSHYDKIILTNWQQFQGIFLDKPTLQSHMANFRALRNAYAHNRAPGSVEYKLGEAALLWLQGVLDKFDQETASDGTNGQVTEDLLAFAPKSQ